MSAAPTTTDNAERPQRRGCLQFSLFSLLLLVVIGCLVGAYLGEQRQRKEVEARLQQKEAENRQYRIDLGILDDRPNVLTISDPKAIHVCQLPAFEQLQWRWRLYLPPGKRWKLGITQGEEWDEVNRRFDGGDSGTILDETGELTLAAELMRELDGQTHLKISWCNRALRASLPGAGLAIVRANGKRTVHLAGAVKQETFPAERHVDLLRWHVALDADAPPEGRILPGRTKPSPSYGFSIYLEEILPSDPLYRIPLRVPRNRPPQ